MNDEVGMQTSDDSALESPGDERGMQYLNAIDLSYEVVGLEKACSSSTQSVSLFRLSSKHSFDLTKKVSSSNATHQTKQKRNKR